MRVLSAVLRVCARLRVRARELPVQFGTLCHLCRARGGQGTHARPGRTHNHDDRDEDANEADDGTEDDDDVGDGIARGPEVDDEGTPEGPIHPFDDRFDKPGSSSARANHGAAPAVRRAASRDRRGDSDGDAGVVHGTETFANLDELGPAAPPAPVAAPAGGSKRRATAPEPVRSKPPLRRDAATEAGVRAGLAVPPPQRLASRRHHGT